MTEFEFIERLKTIVPGIEEEGVKEAVSDLFLEGVKESNWGSEEITDYLTGKYSESYVPTLQHPRLQEAIADAIDWALDNHITEEYTLLDSAEDFLISLKDADHVFDADNYYSMSQVIMRAVMVGNDLEDMYNEEKENDEFTLMYLKLVREGLNQAIDNLESHLNESNNTNN